MNYTAAITNIGGDIWNFLKNHPIVTAIFVLVLLVTVVLILNDCNLYKLYQRRMHQQTIALEDVLAALARLKKDFKWGELTTDQFIEKYREMFQRFNAVKHNLTLDVKVILLLQKTWGRGTYYELWGKALALAKEGELLNLDIRKKRLQSMLKIKKRTASDELTKFLNELEPMLLMVPKLQIIILLYPNYFRNQIRKYFTLREKLRPEILNKRKIIAKVFTTFIDVAPFEIKPFIQQLKKAQPSINDGRCKNCILVQKMSIEITVDFNFGSIYKKRSFENVLFNCFKNENISFFWKDGTINLHKCTLPSSLCDSHATECLNPTHY